MPRPKPRPPAFPTLLYAHDFDVRAACRDLLTFGFILVDDITEGLVEVAKEELMIELGHYADEVDLRITRVATRWGPVFVFRDASRRGATLAKAKEAVFAQHPKPELE